MGEPEQIGSGTAHVIFVGAGAGSVIHKSRLPVPPP